MKKWGVGAAAFGALAAGGYFALSSFAHIEAEARVAQAAGQIRRHVKRFDYSGVDVAPLSQTLRIRDVRLDDGHGLAFEIGSVSFKHFDWTFQDSPRHGRILLDSVRASVDASAAPALKRYGYDRIQAEAELGYAFDDAAETLDVSLRVDVTNAGVLTFHAKFGHMNSKLLAMAARGADDPWTIIFTALTVTLMEATVEFEDHSLVDRAVSAEAQRRGVAPVQIRAELIEAVASSEPQMARTAQSLQSFLEKPGRIKLSAAPQPPLSYTEAINALFVEKTPPHAFLAQRLNLRVTRD
jgi:hypothetical protein